MRRRGFLGMMGGTVAWPLVARAQQTKLSRIGVLVIGNADVPLFGSEVPEGLGESGRIEGQHYLIEFRSAENLVGCPNLHPSWSASRLMSSLHFSRLAR